MYKLDKILCPTDFSDASVEAIRFAAFLARHSGGKLTIMFVDESEFAPPDFFERDEHRIAAHREAIAMFAQGKFTEILARLGIGYDQACMLVRSGTAYREIIDEAESNGYDTVVIATEGLGRSSPHLIGRTAERVVRLCRSPVLTLRPRAEPGSSAPGTSDGRAENAIRCILCPTDFSEYSNYAIPYAVSLARRFKARVILLHVTDLSVQHPELLIGKFPDPQFYHEGAHEIEVEKIVGRDVEPENLIVRFDEENQCDLIVIGTHGARGMRRVQIGNTVEEVVRRARVPVLTITHPIHKTIFPRRFKEDYVTERY